MRRPKILVVDNDADFAVSIRWALEGEGYAVLQARSGREGLAKLARHEPGLIVLSTDVDATTVTEAITFSDEYSPYRGIPIIQVLGRQQAWDAQSGARQENAVVSRYPSIAKPLDVPRFLGMVREALGIKVASLAVPLHEVTVGQ